MYIDNCYYYMMDMNNIAEAEIESYERENDTEVFGILINHYSLDNVYAFEVEDLLNALEDTASKSLIRALENCIEAKEAYAEAIQY